MKKKIAVIGGGIVGSTASYYLAKAGHSVSVFDSGTGQATAAAAGIICPWLSRRRNKKWYRLVSEGAAFYDKLLADLASDGLKTAAYARCGALILGQSADYIQEVHDRAMERREQAPLIGNVAILKGTELKKIFPPLSNVEQALYVGGGARVDGRELTKTLLQATTQFGGTIHKETVSLANDNDGTLAVLMPVGPQKFDAIILAAGAWLPQILQPLGYTVDVRGQKGQLVVLQTEDNDPQNYPVIMPQGEIDLLPFGHGKTVIGASHENDKGYDLQPDASVTDPMLEQAYTWLPQLKDAVTTEIRVGTRAYTSDFSPFFGRVPGLQNCFAASGLGSSGLTSGPLIGYLLAELAQGKESSLPTEDYPIATYVKLVGR
ncbi:NAD(P)/FAD-dependent oxidoreductase [Trichococcus pasteurii]|uniref:Fad dependent oxidoreductase n=1 Tax=Trichococcus pasteurii TaxID=43064 RepID=A0A1W1IH21_9LACT|nr:FAD-dependent oxidoreductase [Trichococcus pasteurii]SFE89088.1 Glycine/D-amino acid oxidase [Trichococcus pasteurii]SLM52325.1 fad dependent oxidoreductase [Trichococcus pasteurii]SSB93206.1 fad dependent oxidoreductase [Trichococcus pasteurii]